MRFAASCCILSKFYIKPQLLASGLRLSKSCILSKFYIKPQLISCLCVLHLCCILSKFYIKPQPFRYYSQCHFGCILSKFYIKPQLKMTGRQIHEVVSYRNSTSNHNQELITDEMAALYLIEILHQTTTSLPLIASGLVLYLIEILHQTTTGRDIRGQIGGCILSKFYIKPQQPNRKNGGFVVVSYRNSTSNHNSRRNFPSYVRLYLIEILHQTTTKSAAINRINGCILSKFYIKPQLLGVQGIGTHGCILSKFYIKPQLRAEQGKPCSVVSYRNSTSNHNQKRCRRIV